MSPAPPQDRVRIEAEALGVEAALCPQHVPQVFLYDKVMALIAMEYVAPPAIILRRGLIQVRARRARLLCGPRASRPAGGLAVGVAEEQPARALRRAPHCMRRAWCTLTWPSTWPSSWRRRCLARPSSPSPPRSTGAKEYSSRAHQLILPPLHPAPEPHVVSQHACVARMLRAGVPPALHCVRCRERLVQFKNPEMCELTEKVIFTEPYTVADNNRHNAPHLDADVAALQVCARALCARVCAACWAPGAVAFPVRRWRQRRRAGSLGVGATLR